MTQEEKTKKCALNNEQRALVAEFNDLVQKMVAANIIISASEYNECFTAINTAEIKEITDMFDAPKDAEVIENCIEHGNIDLDLIVTNAGSYGYKLAAVFGDKSSENESMMSAAL